MEHDGGGSGGLDFGAFKAMINADNPAMLGKYALEHYKLARELHDVAHDLDRSLEQLDEVFDSQHAAPALKARLLSSIRDMDNIGGRIERNSQLLDQAGEALHKARKAVNKINEDSPDASPRAEAIRDELGFRYASITPQLDTFGDGESEPGGVPNNGSKELSGYVTGGTGSARTGGNGIAMPTTSASGRPSTAGRLSPGPTVGGPVGPGGKLDRGSGAGSPKANGRGRTSTTTGKPASGSSARVGIPGARSGTPIGGYRPVASAPSTANGTPPPTGSAPGKPGAPGGPGRPGMVPPGGTSPRQPGKDRPGRRLTDYEKLEPNVFRDTRHRVKPVIGEQRRQPDTFTQTPGAIGGKQAGEEAPSLPELPTRNTPARFEGHDVSVSFTRRTRGSQ